MFERFFARRASLRVAEAKASATGPVVALQQPGRARWTPRDYGALAAQISGDIDGI